MKRLAIPFLFLVSCAVAFGGDVLFSESFENGLSDWKPFKRKPFDAWKVEKGIGRPVGVACPPTTCLVWERKADDPEPYDLVRIVPVKPGQMLKLTAAALMETDEKGFSKGPNIAVGIGNENKTFIWKASNRYAGNNARDVHGWHVLELTLPAVPAEADRIQVVIGVDGKSVGRIRFDDIEISVTEVKTIDRFCCTATDWRAQDGRVLFSGVVCVDPEKCPREELSLRLTAGKKSWPLSLDGQNNAEVAVDVADLPLGASKVRLEALGPDGKLLGSAEHVFTREPLKPKSKRPKVHFDKYQRLVIDGKPTFPLGIYWHQRDNKDDQAFKMLAKSPFNVVVSYDRDMQRETMDKFQSCGKKVFSSVCMAYKYPPEVRRKSLEGITSDADADAFVCGKVKQLKNHPALLGWYIADELPLVMKPKLAARNQLIKKLDSGHVTCLCLIGANGVRDFAECADWIGMDCYPVGGLSASEEEKVHPNMQMFVNMCTDATAQSGGLKPVWSVPQAFNWQGDYKNDIYPWMRFPNLAECRAQAWMSLAGGAKGFMYFMFNTIYGEWKKGNRQPYEDLMRSAEEVWKLSNVLLSVEPEPKVAGVTDKIAVRAISHKGSLYVIVCNRTWQPVSGEMKLEGAWRRAAAEVGEVCVLKDGSTLSYALGPIGVSVMRLDAK